MMTLSKLKGIPSLQEQNALSSTLDKKFMRAVLDVRHIAGSFTASYLMWLVQENLVRL